MAEFKEVCRNWVRMCKSYIGNNDCMKCPLAINPICGCMGDCDPINDKVIDDAEAVIDKWVADHPEPIYPTWGEWLEAIGLIRWDNCENRDSYKIVPTFRMATAIPSDIAEKIGLQPKDFNG